MAAEKLLPLVYEELRRLAAAKMAQEEPGQTLQATALVHEAYVRLVDQGQPRQWKRSRYFFAAAAKAMRRILIERARREKSLKGGGEHQRVELADIEPSFLPIACDDRVVHGGEFQRQDADLDAFGILNDNDPTELLALHEVLDQLAVHSLRKAELLKLRYFLGCTVAETAEILGIAKVRAWPGSSTGLASNLGRQTCCVRWAQGLTNASAESRTARHGRLIESGLTLLRPRLTRA